MRVANDICDAAEVARKQARAEKRKRLEREAKQKEIAKKKAEDERKAARLKRLDEESAALRAELGERTGGKKTGGKKQRNASPAEERRRKPATGATPVVSDEEDPDRTVSDRDEHDGGPRSARPPVDREAKIMKGIHDVVNGRDRPPNVELDMDDKDQADFFKDLVKEPHGSGPAKAMKHFTEEKLKKLSWEQLVILRGLLKAHKKTLDTWAELKEAYDNMEERRKSKGKSKRVAERETEPA
jgi:hypothetical protein